MSVHIFTTAFCNAKVFAAGMQSLHDTVDFDALGAHHYVLDNHYPLDAISAHAAIDAYAASREGKVTVVDAGRNLGLHEGLNHLFDRFGKAFDGNDMLVAYDADEAPVNAGWAAVMASVFASDPKAGWLSLNCNAVNESLERQGVAIEVRAGQRMRVPTFPMMNVVVGWRVDCVRLMGLFQEPHAYYGGIELAMQPLCREQGFYVGFLEDFWTSNHRGYADRVYELYKLRHVGHELPHFPGSFDEFLQTEAAK